MFANRFEWQEKLARTQSPPCNLSLFFSVFLSLTQVFALHCNHVHVHGGCFLSVAGRQIASIWLKGICYISPQHEKCRHTHTSFFFPFECLEMMFVYLDFICQSRQRPHCAFANKSALMVQLHYILLFHDEKTHPPRVYVSLATNNICTFCCVVCQTYTECDIFRFTFQMFEGKLYSFHIYVWTYLPLWSLLTIIIIFCSCFLANLNFWCINKICNGRNLQNKNLVLCLFSVQETTIWIRAPNICLYRAKFK